MNFLIQNFEISEESITYPINYFLLKMPEIVSVGTQFLTLRINKFYYFIKYATLHIL